MTNFGIAANDKGKIKTFDKKDDLKSNGFKWSSIDAGRKYWIKESANKEEIKEIFEYLFSVGLTGELRVNMGKYWESIYDVEFEDADEYRDFENDCLVMSWKK